MCVPLPPCQPRFPMPCPILRPLRLHTAAVMRDSYSGMWGKQPVLVGSAVDTCNALLRIALEAEVTGGLIDSSLHDELQYSFQCRMINIITVNPSTTAAKSYGVYELQEEKQVTHAPCPMPLAELPCA